MVKIVLVLLVAGPPALILAFRVLPPSIASKRTYWESNGQVTRRVRVG